MNTQHTNNQEELTPLDSTQSTELILYRALLCLSGALTDHLRIKFVVTGDYVGYEHNFYKIPKSLTIVLLSDNKGLAAKVDEVQKSLCALVSDDVKIFTSEKPGRIRFNDTLPSQYLTRTSCRIKLICYRDAHVDVQMAYSQSRLITSRKGPWKTTPPILNVLDSLSMFPVDGHRKRQGQKVIQRLQHMIRQVLPGDDADGIFVANDHFRSIRRISDHIPEAYLYAPLKKYLDIRPRVAIGHEGSMLNPGFYGPVVGGTNIILSGDEIENDDDGALAELAKKLSISPSHLP